MSLKKTFLTCIAMLTFVAAAGCSNDESDSGDTIKIGVICSCSGAAGFSAAQVPTRDVVTAWAESINAAGGIEGREIELIHKDDTSDPANAVTVAQELVAEEVVAIISVSTIDQVFIPVVEAAKIPVIGVYSNFASFETSPYFYPQGQTGSSENLAIVRVAKEANVDSLGLLYCAEVPVCAEIAPAMSDVGKEMGIPLVYQAKIAATEPNFTAQCLAAKEAGAEALYVGQVAEVQYRVAAECEAQNYHPIYILNGGGSGEAAFQSPGLRERMWAAYPTLPFFADSPEVDEFEAAMAEHAPEVRSNELFTHYSFTAWVAMKAVEKAIVAGGLSESEEPTAAMVIKGLHTFKDETLDGLTVPLSFEDDGKPHQVNCWFTGRVQNGKPEVLNGGEPTCE